MSNCENLPADLRENGRFCLWRYEERDGRQAKVPHNPRTGERARANDPDTFDNFSAQRYLATADDRQRFVILTAPHKYTDFGCADINRAYNITSFKHGKIKPRNVT